MLCPTEPLRRMEDRFDWPSERIRRHIVQDADGQNAYFSRGCVDLPQRGVPLMSVQPIATMSIGLGQ
jgi:hypothetical protein